jgi:hypothetical protein
MVITPINPSNGHMDLGSFYSESVEKINRQTYVFFEYKQCIFISPYLSDFLLAPQLNDVSAH